jgi:uncharacterized protein YueI
MIISKDINPERDYYYLGAKVIEILSKSDVKKHDYFSTFEELKSSENISINLFTLTLDWLFILGAIEKSERGFITKCF